MIQKAIVIQEKDFLCICDKLENICVDASHLFIRTNDPENVKELAERIYYTSRNLLEELREEPE